MVRTQIYLTERQRIGLSAIARTSGRKQSELIREAVDSFIERMGENRQNTILENAAGIWRDRDDLPNFESLRREWDR